MRSLLTIIFLVSFVVLRAQFAPPAGQEGSTAIAADSAIFVEWANECKVLRGWVKISDTTLGKAAYGTEENGTGFPDNAVVSLGDAGEAVLFFEHPLTNGPGWDFAVFENSFDDAFLELAFVEVSSDGERFFRFPSVSLTQTEEQVESFGSLDATKIYDLAGKYRAKYGTPFDLEELKDEQELDVNHIIAVKVIDVVGCIEEGYARHDSEGHKINDPWPTPFESGGFDLDAVGVIHNTVNGVGDRPQKFLTVFPNPCSEVLNVNGDVEEIILRDLNGRMLKTEKSNKVDLTALPDGMLIVQVILKKGEIRFFKVLKK
jgi:hypothetical protein